MCTEHLWKEAQGTGRTGCWGAEAGWLGDRVGEWLSPYALSNVWNLNHIHLKRKTYKLQHFLKTGGCSCLCSLSENEAKSEASRARKGEIDLCWHHVSAWILLFHLCSSYVSSQMLFGLNLFELCWQVSWLLCPSKISCGFFFKLLLRYNWQTYCVLMTFFLVCYCSS